MKNVQAIRSWSDGYVVLTKSNNNLLNVMNQIRAYNLENVTYENSNLINQSQYEENEQIVKDIYMSTLAVENFNFTQSQITSIESIMEQCPFVGGPSVYTARMLYSLIDPTIIWDDDDLCILAGISPRLAKPEQYSALSVFPNPAYDHLKITYELNEGVDAEFYLYNSLGELILQKKLNYFQSELLIYLKGITAGIYSCLISYDGAIKYNNSISIVR